jgi:uncharacterized protein YdhG (YjbR/CyaY superfamily)
LPTTRFGWFRWLGGQTLCPRQVLVGGAGCLASDQAANSKIFVATDRYVEPKENPLSTKQNAPETVDEYIAGFPPDVQQILEKIRRTIKKAVPDATETIKYKMPTFTLNGNLVYFGAFQKHIGFYPPLSSGSAKFRKELTAYEGPKRSLIFPLDKPIPYDLIRQIVELRVKENLGRPMAAGKKK